MNEVLAQLPPIVLALLIIYLLIKDAVIPLIKKKNGTNPVNLEIFYQEFKIFKEELFPAFKEETEKRCEKRGLWLKEIDEKVDEIRIKGGGN